MLFRRAEPASDRRTSVAERSGEVRRPVALVTGASRRRGIGAAVARALAADGWDVATTFWVPYDERMPWGSDADAPDRLRAELEALGAATVGVAADLERPDVPERLVAEVEAALGPIRALVLSHCESVDSTIRETTVASFDRHLAVNARATWLLIRAFAARFSEPHGTGRIVALTSDHTAGNLPYGASKGAMDRIVLAAAVELAGLGITANVVNPGATDTGWMDDALLAAVREATLLGRVGQPEDGAALVRFLCSPDGGWINGQLLFSDGGRRP
jgi:3-oxoacyl-[acyl-carrier protein] reductase